MTWEADRNFAYSTVLSLPVTVDGSHRSFPVKPGDGALFAAPDRLTVWQGLTPSTTTATIINCTGVSGDVITYQYAQEGTPDLAILPGFRVASCFTVGKLADLRSAIDANTAGIAALTSAGVGAFHIRGTWNAATNTPTLADATGTAGDLYRVSTGGTRDLGSGAQVFAVGDEVWLDSSLVWRRSIGTATVVTATDATITVGGTSQAPTIGVNAIPESKVTGLTTDLGTLSSGIAARQLRWNVRVVAVVGGGSTFTLAAYDQLEVDATLGNATVNPPASPAMGDEVTIKKTDASSNTVTFQGTLDGTTNPALVYRYGTFRAVWDGTVWIRPDRHTLTSAPDYATLRGGVSGLGSLDSGGHQPLSELSPAVATGSQRTVTAATTITTADSIVLLDATSGAFAQPLPASASMTGKRITLTAITAGQNVVTVVPASGLIDGQPYLTLGSASSTAQAISVDLIPAGANWATV